MLRRFLNRAMVMSGSLFPLLLPSSASVDFPESKQTRSFDNLPSFFHLKFSFGVVCDAAGSCRLRSRLDVEGCRNDRCGSSNSQNEDPPHDPGFCRTCTCWSGAYSWTMKSVGITGSGGGGMVSPRRSSAAVRVCCCHSGLTNTSAKSTSELKVSKRAME